MTSMTSLDAVVFLAETIAPDEVDIAPDMLDAACRGERPDEADYDDALGGFGDLGSILPETWSVCVSLIEWIPQMTDYVVPLSGGITIGRSIADLLRSVKAAPKGTVDAERLDKFIDLLSEALAAKGGVKPDRAGGLARDTLGAFTRSPEAAEVMIDALADRKPR